MFHLPYFSFLFGMLQLSFFVVGVILILLPFCKFYELVLALTLVFGIFDGCFVAVVGPIAFQFCGPEGASQAIGFILGLSSIPLTIGPPIAGKETKSLDYLVIRFLIC